MSKKLLELILRRGLNSRRHATLILGFDFLREEGRPNSPLLESICERLKHL